MKNNHKINKSILTANIIFGNLLKIILDFIFVFSLIQIILVYIVIYIYG